MKPLVIVGAGGHGRETLDIVEAINAASDASVWNFLGFIASDPDVEQRVERRGSRILGDIHHLLRLSAVPEQVSYVLGIGHPQTRAKLDGQLSAAGLPAATLVHPNATVGKDNRLAPGVVLAAGAHVTTNVTLQRHVHVNVNAVVSHDSTVNGCTSLSPGTLVNGSVTIGQRVMVGSGAVITPSCTIGDDTIVGAGAVVVSDVPANATAIGVPARWGATP